MLNATCKILHQGILILLLSQDLHKLKQEMISKQLKTETNIMEKGV